MALSATMPSAKTDSQYSEKQRDSLAMKLLFGGMAAMVVFAGAVTAAEAEVSNWSYFLGSAIGASFGALSTYTLVGRKNDSRSLAGHMCGNISVGTFCGAMLARHGMTAIGKPDIISIAFCGYVVALCGMAVIGGIRGTFTLRSIRQMVATMCHLELPEDRKTKHTVIDEVDDIN